MGKWEEGDKAVLELEKELKKIISNDGSLENKIKLIGAELQDAIKPWNIKGDDSVIGEMLIKAGVAIDDIINKEIEEIKSSKEKIQDKKAKLERIKGEVDKISWLAEGFKSSIRVKISFAIFNLKN